MCQGSFKSMAILSMAFKSMVHVTLTRSRPLLKQFKKNWEQVFQQKERISSSVRSILKTILWIVFPMGPPPPLKKCEKCKVEHQVASQIFKDLPADLLIAPISKTTKTNHQRQWFVHSQWNSNWYWFRLFYLLLSWPTVNFGSLSRG